MRIKKIFQSGSILLLLVIIFALLQQGLAQDEENTGVDGIADTANNLDVPPVPMPDEVTNIVGTPDGNIFTGFDTTAIVQTPPPNSLITIATGHAFRPTVAFGKILPTLVTFRRQTEDIIYESSNDDGDVMLVFADYSLVATTAEGQEYLTGYLALNSAGDIIIVGTDTKGYQYVFDNDYLIGLTVNGNVFMGMAEFLYFYDYDEDGNFLALSDSDGNEYEVKFNRDGSFYITDTEGNSAEFYADGTYAIYDEDGNTLEEGEWSPNDEASSTGSESDAPVMRWFFDDDGNYVEVLSDGTVVVTDPDGNVTYYSEDELVDENGELLYSEEELDSPDNIGSDDGSNGDGGSDDGFSDDSGADVGSDDTSSDDGSGGDDGFSDDSGAEG
jgi:hypothetical protein